MLTLQWDIHGFSDMVYVWGRGVFRTQSNNWDLVFCKNS